MTDLNRNIIYDKFLQIEGWAYRGKVLVENRKMDLARKAGIRIKNDLKELLVLLKDKEV
jgi:hypothetical protein